MNSTKSCKSAPEENLTYQSSYRHPECRTCHMESGNGDIKDLVFKVKKVEGIIAFHISRRCRECGTTCIFIYPTRADDWKFTCRENSNNKPKNKIQSSSQQVRCLLWDYVNYVKVNAQLERKSKRKYNKLLTMMGL